jgi:hypothetical protein
MATIVRTQVISMTHLVLATTLASTLLLNGSMAAASMPEPIGVCTEAQQVCRIALRMMAPPPPRPAHITARVVERRSEAVFHHVATGR